MTMFMRIDKLRGNVSGGKFDGCFKIDSFQWGCGMAIYDNNQGFREYSQPSLSEVTISLPFDAHLTLLCGLQLAGAEFAEIELIFPDHTCVLGQVAVSGFSISGGVKKKKTQGKEVVAMNASLSLNFVSFSLRNNFTEGDSNFHESYYHLSEKKSIIDGYLIPPRPRSKTDRFGDEEEAGEDKIVLEKKFTSFANKKWKELDSSAPFSLDYFTAHLAPKEDKIELKSTSSTTTTKAEIAAVEDDLKDD